MAHDEANYEPLMKEQTESKYDGYKDPVEGHEGAESAAKPMAHPGKSPIALHGGK